MAHQENVHHQDPYAPPPRHKDKSGAVVRVAIVAALLAGAGWGYMNMQSGPQTALVPAEEQTFADARAPDGSYRVNTPDTLAPATVAPAAAPAATPSAPAQRSAAPAPAPEPVPPPSTTIAPSTAPAPLPPIDSPSGD